jgi:hypothetical protein
MTATIPKGLFAGEELRNSFVERFSFRRLNSLDSLDGKRQWFRACHLLTYHLKRSFVHNVIFFFFLLPVSTLLSAYNISRGCYLFL